MFSSGTSSIIKFVPVKVIFQHFMPRYYFPLPYACQRANFQITNDFIMTILTVPPTNSSVVIKLIPHDRNNILMVNKLCWKFRTRIKLFLCIWPGATNEIVHRFRYCVENVFFIVAKICI